MTTPTREQAFDQWLKARYFETVEGRSEFITTCTRDLMREAHTAGREQGLREAYDIALRAPFKQPELDAEEWESPDAAHDAGLKSMAFDITAEIRAAIEQLRGK